ncbi:Hypothetical predicted protein [Mytilus galloprovincialis]|uniref:Uncharacterized protein n=1 Tax=Mytilus galloprovincialis TaxID=29158 RepID=A0A8B6HG19_MYTGA|nr:Hypothetical predicted protein [Mytilus galloprovincialis]
MHKLMLFCLVCFCLATICQAMTDNADMIGDSILSRAKRARRTCRQGKRCNSYRDCCSAQACRRGRCWRTVRFRLKSVRRGRK